MNKSYSIYFYDLIFFMIWPLLALILRLKTWRFNKGVFGLALGFCAYLGFNLIPGGVGGADSARYAEDLRVMHDSDISLAGLFSSFYDAKTQEVDIYQPTLTYLVSLFTNDHRILFALFAFVFAYFWLKNLQIVVSKLPARMFLFIGLVLTLFLLVNPIWNINGVRMWTAGQVFVFGIFNLILLNKRSGWWFIIFAPLIHWSYYILVIVAFGILLIIRIPLWTLVLIYFFSISFAEVNIEQVREIQSDLPTVFRERSKSYTSEVYIKKRSKEVYAWHITLARNIQNWFVHVWVLIGFLRGARKRKWSRNWENLFRIGLLIGVVGHLGSQIPSGGRFITIANMILLPIIAYDTMLSRKSGDRSWKTLDAIATPALVFTIVVLARFGLDFFGYGSFIGNPVTVLIAPDDTPVINFIKSLL